MSRSSNTKRVVPKADMRAFCEKTGEEPEEAEKFFFQRSYSYYSSSSESRLTLQEALTQYENDPQVQKRKEKERSARKKLEPIFQKYAAMTGDADAIFEDSLTAFYKDIGVNPEDNKMTLGLMWQMRGTTLGELRKEEFLQGFAAQQCESLSDLRTLARSTPSLIDQDFKKFYNYLFVLAKSNKADKVANTEYALDLWGVLLPMVPNFATHEDFLAFIQEKQPAHVSRDLWQCVYDFSQHVRDDYSRHSEADAWNSTIDEFAAWMKAKQEKQEA